MSSSPSSRLSGLSTLFALQCQPAQSELNSSGHGQVAGDVTPHGAFADVQLTGRTALRHSSVVEEFLQLFWRHALIRAQRPIGRQCLESGPQTLVGVWADSEKALGVGVKKTLRSRSTMAPYEVRENSLWAFYRCGYTSLSFMAFAFERIGP